MVLCRKKEEVRWNVRSTLIERDSLSRVQDMIGTVPLSNTQFREGYGHSKTRRLRIGGVPIEVRQHGSNLGGGDYLVPSTCFHIQYCREVSRVQQPVQVYLLVTY